MIVQHSISLPRTNKTLILPTNPDLHHPLHRKLTLLMCHLSSDALKIKTFQAKLCLLSCPLGDEAHKGNTLSSLHTQVGTILCSSRQIDYISATAEYGIKFLAELYAAGCGYSALNSARSALSAVAPLFQTSTFGSHPLVCRFMKGVFETKPLLPRYTKTWNVNIMMIYLVSLCPPKELTLRY